MDASKIFSSSLVVKRKRFSTDNVVDFDPAKAVLEINNAPGRLNRASTDKIWESTSWLRPIANVEPSPSHVRRNGGGIGVQAPS